MYKPFIMMLRLLPDQEEVLLKYDSKLVKNAKYSINFLLLIILTLIQPNEVFSQISQSPDIIIRGIDTEIDPCNSKSILLTATSELTSGFSFNLSAIDLEEEENTSIDWGNGLENIRFKFIGSDTIQIGDNLCIIIICQEYGGEVTLSLNGVDISSNFEITSTHGSLFEKEFTTGRGLYISKGEFVDFNNKTRLVGNVYDGFYLSTYETDLNQPYPLGMGESKNSAIRRWFLCFYRMHRIR